MARFFNVLVALYVGLAVVQSDFKRASRADGLPYHYRGRWILPNDGHPHGEQSLEDPLEAPPAWPAGRQTSALEFTEQEAPHGTEQEAPHGTEQEAPHGTEQEAPHGTEQEAHGLKEQDVEDSTVWKGLVLAAVLLVSAVAALSLVYYLCVWRGGRVHYQPQYDLSSGM